MATFPIVPRKRLNANLTFYVRTDGADANSGLADTAAGAFLTVQYAVDVVLKTIDRNGYDVVIQVGAGTRTAGVIINGPCTGPGNFSIYGDLTTPANCKLNVTSGNCFQLTNGAFAYILGFELTTTTSGDCLFVDNCSRLIYGTMRFGACAGLHVDVSTESNVTAGYDYTIFGGALGHFHTGSPSTLSASAITITLTGTPAFSVFFCGSAGGFQYLALITFSGAATGKRYLIHKGGVVDVGTTSLTFLPGSTAGTVESGGKYCGEVTSPDVIGPSGATVDNTIPRFDGTGTLGPLLQTSGIVIDDSNNITPPSNDGGALKPLARRWRISRTLSSFSFAA